MRLESPLDSMFLEQLYCESREDLYPLASQPEMFQQLIQMQLAIHLKGIEQRYPDAQSWVIFRDEQSIGRMVIDIDETDLRLVDLAISVTARNQRVAYEIMCALQHFAGQHHFSVSLSVMCNNVRAIGLYQKCGFVPIREDGVFLHMRWKPL